MKKYLLILGIISLLAFMPQQNTKGNCDELQAKFERLKTDLDKTKELLDFLKAQDDAQRVKMDADMDTLILLKEKLRNYEGEGDIEYFRKLKAELWKLRSEIRDLKKKNEELVTQVEKCK